MDVLLMGLQVRHLNHPDVCGSRDLVLQCILKIHSSIPGSIENPKQSLPPICSYTCRYLSSRSIGLLIRKLHILRHETNSRLSNSPQVGTRPLGSPSSSLNLPSLSTASTNHTAVSCTVCHATAGSCDFSSPGRTSTS